MPNFGGPPIAVQITLVSLDGKVTFSPVGPVDSGTEVTMTAADWYEITAVEGPINETVTVPADMIVTTLTAAAYCSVTATVDYASGDFNIGNDYPISSVGPWAEANGLGEGDVTAAMEDDYLLNVAPATDATIEITEITVVGTTVTVKVGASVGASTSQTSTAHCHYIPQLPFAVAGQ